MTLNVETPRVVYTGSGTRGPFALSVGGTPITYSAASHIIAERYTDAGVLIETLVDGVDYDLSATSVATGDSAATLTIKVSADVLASDEKLVIYRETPLSQTLSLVQGGGFSSSANEANYDKIFRLLQELYLQFGRQVTINPISSSVAVNLPVPQAGYVVGWNADGDGFENYSSIPTDTVSVSSAWAQVINKATIALGLTEAGFSAFIQTLINDADQATALNTLGAQPLDADLTAIAALGYTSGQYLTKKTAANTYSLITVTPFIETLLDDATAETARATLGAASNPNAIINGDCRVAQYGSVAFTGNQTKYGGCDRIPASVSSFSTFSGTLAQAGVAGSDVSTTGFVQQMGPVTSTGSGSIAFITRLESRDVAHFNGKTVTLSARVFQDTGAPITATINLYKPTALDNFASTTFIAGQNIATNGSASAAGSVTATLGASDASNGLAAVIVIPVGAVTGKYFWVGDLKLEPGAVVTPIQPKSFSDELAECQRYFEKSYNHGTALGAVTAVGAAALPVNGNAEALNNAVEVKFSVRKRLAASMSYWDLAGNGSRTSSFTGGGGAQVDNNNNVSSFVAGEGSATMTLTAGGALLYKFHWAAGCEL